MGYAYKKGNESRKYTVNHSFFKVWSHDMAYILGFWFADGFIALRDSCFSISQHKKDKYILYDILRIMGANYPLANSRNNKTINIYSNEIVNDIISLGGKERKSLDVKFPKVPKKYLSDFVRGYFDGDGSVSRLKNGCFESSFTTGSKKFAYTLLKEIEDNSTVKGTVQIKTRKKGENLFGERRKVDSIYYCVRFYHNNSIRLRNFMYQNKSIKLLRKYSLLCTAGEITQIKSGFLTYNEAKKIIHTLGLRSKTEWENYWKKNKRLINLPSTPSRTYKDNGWVSWQEWLGYKNKITKGEKQCV
jgi:hypothetical protein